MNFKTLKKKVGPCLVFLNVQCFGWDLTGLFSCCIAASCSQLEFLIASLHRQFSNSVMSLYSQQVLHFPIFFSKEWAFNAERFMFLINWSLNAWLYILYYWISSDSYCSSHQGPPVPPVHYANPFLFWYQLFFFFFPLSHSYFCAGVMHENIKEEASCWKLH